MDKNLDNKEPNVAPGDDEILEEKASPEDINVLKEVYLFRLEKIYFLFAFENLYFPDILRLNGWYFTHYLAAVAVSAGFRHSLGLKSAGTVVTVGNKAFGQCNVSRTLVLFLIQPQKSLMSKSKGICRNIMY